MKKPSKHWEDNLGNRLQNLQADTSIRSWERLVAALEDKPKKPNWLLIAAAIALLMAPAAFWLWQTGNAPASPGFAIAEPAPSTPNSTLINEGQQPGLPSQEQQTSAALQTGQAPHPAASASKEKGITESAEQVAALGSQNSTNPSGLRKEPTEAHAPATAGVSNKHQQPAPARLPHRTKEAGTSPLQDARPSTSTASIEATSEGISNPDIAGEHSTETAAPDAKEAIAPGLVLNQEPQLASLEAKEANAISPIAPEPLVVQNYRVKVPTIAIQRPLSVVLREAALARAEESPKKEKAASLWVEALPTLSYYMVEPSKTDHVMVTSVESEPALSGSRLGGQLAAGISMPVLKKLSWKSGGYYWYQQQHLSYTYQNTKPDAYAYLSDASGMSRLEAVHTPQSNTIDMPLHNVGVSTGLSYKLSGKELQSFVETEVLAHYNVHQKISSFVSIGYSIKTKFTSKTSLRVGPAVQYQINSSESLSPHFKDKPISFGIQLGVGFKE